VKVPPEVMSLRPVTSSESTAPTYTGVLKSWWFSILATVLAPVE
jgi:hypothetical protein